MTWVAYILISVVLFAFSNVLDKIILTRWIRDPRINTLGNAVVGLCIALGVFLAGSIGPGSLWFVFLNLIAGALYIAAGRAYFLAVQKEEISRIAALTYVGPIIIAIASVPLFGEQLSALIYLGVVLLVIGAILVGSHSWRAIRLSVGFWWMLLAVVLFSASTLLNAVTLESQDFWTVFAETRFGAALGALILIPASVIEGRRVLRSTGVKPLLAILLSEGAALAGMLLITAALGLAPATQVNALGSIQPFVVLVVTVLLSRFSPILLREEISPNVLVQKVIGVLAMVVGAYLVT